MTTKDYVQRVTDRFNPQIAATLLLDNDEKNDALTRKQEITHWTYLAKANHVQPYDHHVDLDILKIYHYLKYLGLKSESFANTVTHRIAVGGGKLVEKSNPQKKVANLFLQHKEIVEVVYHYEIQDETEFVVVLKEDFDEASNFIARIELEAYKLYPDLQFEANYVIKDSFDENSIPVDATVEKGD